ncbi:MAG: HAMP domain-containing sensor histidine kinase [Bacteroidota bacterium]
MKLLSRISRSYLIISLIVFIFSGLIFYQLLSHIFQKQIDDTLKVEQLLVEQTINYSDSVPDFRLVFGHMIDVTILNTPLKKHGIIHDTLMYDSDLGEFASFRHLFAENSSIRNKGYTINIYKPLIETENLIAEILIAVALVFISLMITLAIANYFIARRVWIPFYRILAKLGHYQIDKAQPLQLLKTRIHEFNLLNDALEKMSAKISQDYQNLKEFNENASHELQTPLAIIKSKLELLIQKENLDENQYRLISNIYEATNRISRLNQGLLLISKIDNNQFLQTEDIDLQKIINIILDHFSDLIAHREIRLSTKFISPGILKMNHSLAETFFSNLISNAMKHNISQGFIEIAVDQNTFKISNSGQILKTNPAQLFERFRKSDSNQDSVGLGLSIVQRIASLYEFEISYLHHDGVHEMIVNFGRQTLQN